MAAATPLRLIEDVDFFAADDAYVAGLPPEIRAAIESAEERVAAGTARLVPHAEVVRAIEEQRIAAGDPSATRR
jgi:hypothetical protein